MYIYIKLTIAHVQNGHFMHIDRYCACLLYISLSIERPQRLVSDRQTVYNRRNKSITYTYVRILNIIQKELNAKVSN